MLDIKDSVKVDGQKYPIHFGMGAMSLIMRETGKKTLEDMFSAEILQHMEGQVIVAKAGLIYGARRHNKKTTSEKSKKRHEFDTDDVYEIFDDAPEQFNTIIGAFMDSVMTRQAKALGEDPKKFKERVLKKGIEIIEKQQELSPSTASKK